MSDAVKNVTIRLNVVRGTIEPINSAIIKEATSAYVELAKAEKTVVEQQMAMVDASKQVNQAQKTVGESAKATAQAAVTGDNTQLASGERRRAIEESAEKTHVEKILETRRPLREPGTSKPTTVTPGSLNVTEPSEWPGVQNSKTTGTDTAKADAQQMMEYSASVEADLDSQRTEREKKERETTNRIQAERSRANAESFAAEQQRAAQANDLALRARQMQIEQDQEEMELERKLEEEKSNNAEKTLNKIRVSELRNIREREQEEQSLSEKQRRDAESRFSKIRQSELRSARERVADEEAENERRIRGAETTLQKIRKAELQAIRDRYAEAETTIQKIRQKELEAVQDRREAAQKAETKMPALQRGALQDVTQSIAAVATLTSHLSMLKSIGGDSLEDIAKKFAKIQSTVGLISSTQSMFTNMGEGLGKLTQMGTATATIVAQQRALGVATTFTQMATLRLAGAAGVAQAAMGPIALVATAIMAAIVAAEIAMSLFGEAAEETVKKFEDNLKKQNEELQKGIDLLSRQKDVMNEQLAIVQQHWETKRLMAGEDGLSMGQTMKQLEEERERRDKGSQSGLQKSFAEAQKEGITDKQKAEQTRITTQRAEEEKRLERTEYDLNSSDFDTATAAAYTTLVSESKLAQLKKDEEKLNAEMNTPAAQGIASTQIEGGLIVDFDTFNKNLQSLPDNMKDAATGFVKELSAQQREMFQSEKAALGSAESAMRSAKSESSNAERTIESEKKRFGGEQEFAARFGLTDSQYAMKDAEDALDRFDSATTADDKEAASKEAEDILRKQGLLSSEADSKLSGSSRDSTAFRMQLKDDSEIDESEIKESDSLIATQTDNKMKADAIIAQGDKVAKDLKERLREIDAQQQQLLQILDNRL